MDKCPPFNDFFYPLMQLALNKEMQVRECSERIADQFNLTTEARLEMVPSGSKPRYVDRTQWAATYLRQVGVLDATRRGYIKVSATGRNFLDSLDGTKITRSDLMQFQPFRDFVERQRPKKARQGQEGETVSASFTPMDQISAALEEIQDELAADILDRLMAAPPSFFERAVIDLLMAMGYGGQNNAAGHVTGKSGDNGIDGVIDQDQLGLDRVYVQAKRYALENTVSAEAVRAFTGALSMHQGTKGLFLTTSTFSKSAEDTADRVGQRVVLIDGARLARLMIAHGVGCTTRRTISVMQIDRDYFE